MMKTGVGKLNGGSVPWLRADTHPKMTVARDFRKRISVTYALLVRDALKKYGHENLGFFWVIAEPLAFTTGIIILWNLGGHEHGDLPITTFALTAYTMLTMFRHMSQGFIHILRSNANVMYHGHVKPLDLLVARAVLETIGCLATFFVAYVPLALLGIIDPIRDPLLVFSAWFLAAWFSFSFGAIAGSLSELSELVERIFPPLMYLTLPVTGAFTMQDWLPQKARDIFAYSPLVNTMEMFRCGMFSEDVVTYWNVSYVICWCLAQTVVALFLLEKAREHLEIS